MAGPLTGIRIIDITAVLLGPSATQIFGDFGADVIKVESPAGDTTRALGPSRHSDMGPLFLHTNRNKRSIVLDLKQPEGREALLRLAKTADVLFHNLRPDAIERLGLGYEDLRAVNPGIVYCAAFGYGRAGRYGKRPAYDDMIQAAVALPDLARRSGGALRYIPAALIDRMVALSAVSSTIAALYHREKTGEGQSIEVPMFETMAQMILAEHMGGATFDPPLGGMGYGRLLSPGRKPYPTSDGHICVMAYTDKHWSRLFAREGRTDLAEDPRFATLSARTKNIDALYRHAEEIFLTRSTREWLAILDELDIPVMQVNTLESLLEDEHLADVGFFEQIEHPSEGRIRMMGKASTWSKTQPEVRMLAPRLGQHSREVLGEAGYSAAEIDDLAGRGITLAADDTEKPVLPARSAGGKR